MYIYIYIYVYTHTHYIYIIHRHINTFDAVWISGTRALPRMKKNVADLARSSRTWSCRTSTDPCGVTPRGMAGHAGRPFVVSSGKLTVCELENGHRNCWCTHKSSWKLPFKVDLPIENGGFPVRYVNVYQVWMSGQITMTGGIKIHHSNFW